MIAHNARPIIFYRDTHTINLNLKLPATKFGKPPTVTIQCSPAQKHFMDKVLGSLRQAHLDIRRLLSLPGFTHLLECDSYLKRSYEADTQLVSQMVCKRIYRPTLRACKIWAISHCKKIDPHEKIWLKRLSRAKRSTWACHAGALGLIRKIYTTFGGSCNSDKLVGLKKTLTDLTDALQDEHSLITTVNGKTVQLLKITDQLTSRINTLGSGLSSIDATLTKWKAQINDFGKKEKCHYDSILEFSSRYSSESTKMFNSLLRFFEIQDIFHQFARFQGKELVGYNDLPESLASTLSSHLQKQRNFKYTAKALADGFPILMNPVTQYHHQDQFMSLHTLLTLPRVATKTSFCTIEYLSPITYQANRQCYAGPLTRNDLVLVSCSDSIIVFKADTLTKCLTQRGTLVCPETVTRRSQDSSWLGLPWTPSSTITFPRTHSPTTCDATDHIFHLGGRYYLSTRKQTIQLSTGPLRMSPLAVYHIPCNATSDTLTTGFGSCPSTITITFPIFRRKIIKYVPWTPMDNNATINLHYKSLNVPPPLKLNKTVLIALDRTFQRLDGDLAIKLQKVRQDINRIHEVNVTPTAIILASIAISLSLINVIVFIALCCYHRHRHTSNLDLVHYVQTTAPQQIYPPCQDPHNEALHVIDNCPDCGTPPPHDSDNEN